MAAVLKLNHEGEMHRVLLREGSVTYETVQENIQKLYPGKAIVAKYSDQEGDLCTLCKDSFSDFVGISHEHEGRKILKLELTGETADFPQVGAEKVATERGPQASPEVLDAASAMSEPGPTDEVFATSDEDVQMLRATEELSAMVDEDTQMPDTIGDATRIQECSYYFEEAKAQMGYSLFVPRSYKEGVPVPLIVLLHGLGSTHHRIIRYNGIVPEANKRGYIVVAPLGHNTGGWYGSRGQGRNGTGKLSERDVLNVLGIVRKQFCIDDRRIYLMGHSMGAAGTLHLAATYPETWAGAAPMSPPVRALASFSERMPAMRHIPVIVATGEADKVTPVAPVRKLVQAMQQLEIDCQYVEIPGAGHLNPARNPNLIARIFDFFDAKIRPTPAPAQEQILAKFEVATSATWYLSERPGIASVAEAMIPGMGGYMAQAWRSVAQAIYPGMGGNNMASRGATQARAPCPGNCGFMQTWHPSHCCAACANGLGHHGKRCERVPCQ